VDHVRIRLRLCRRQSCQRPAVDVIGGRKIFLGGMIGSIACTVAFGWSHGLIFFLLFWALNRFIQSGGLECPGQDRHNTGSIITNMAVLWAYSAELPVWRRHREALSGPARQMGLGLAEHLDGAALTLGSDRRVLLLTVRDHPHAHQIVGALERRPVRTTCLRSVPRCRGASRIWRHQAFSEQRSVLVRGHHMLRSTLIRETFNFWLPSISPKWPA